MMQIELGILCHELLPGQTVVLLRELEASASKSNEQYLLAMSYTP